MGFDFSNISLMLFMSISTSAYSRKYMVSGLNTIYQCYEVKKYQPAFAIHTYNGSVIIAIRGSQEDADFQTYSDFNEIHTPYGIFHSGYYQAAMYVYSRTYHYFTSSNTKVYFTGHSYGGSVASIIMAIVRTRHPSLQALAISFGPPPSMDLLTSIKNKNDIITIVNKNDVIPTLSIGNIIEKLKKMHPKYGVLPKQQITNELYKIFDSYNTTGVVYGSEIVTKMKLVLPTMAERALKVSRGIKYEVRYPAGSVYRIGIPGTTSIYDSLIDPKLSLNCLEDSIDAISHHSPKPYIATLQQTKMN